MDITETLQANSDQLNAVDLIASPITVKILDVSVNKKSDQPVSIKIDGGLQPYKPCKSMRRLLAKVWGTDSKDWINKSMTLFCDMNVIWAGQAVGGIRISHLSGLSEKTEIPLRASRTKTVVYTIYPIKGKNDSSKEKSFIEQLQEWISSMFPYTVTEQDAKLLYGEIKSWLNGSAPNTASETIAWCKSNVSVNPLEGDSGAITGIRFERKNK